MQFNPYYSNRELRQMGFKSLGRHVLISRTCRIYTPDKISIGSNVIIDDFTIMNGEITIGSYIHIGSNNELYAGDSSITIEDFAGTSSRCTFYASSDDYSGAALHNPVVPRQFRKEFQAPIVQERYGVIGTGGIVLPGVRMGEGCSFGAMCLINKSTEPWGIYVGAPARRVKERKRDLVEMANKLMDGQ